jgi:hypothetical protein
LTNTSRFAVIHIVKGSNFKNSQLKGA